jgi:hypothetical protein
MTPLTLPEVKEQLRQQADDESEKNPCVRSRRTCGNGNWNPREYMEAERRPTPLEGLRKEVLAGGVLLPYLPEERAWNDCIQRTLDLIDKYKKGEGLFQIL